MSSIRRLTSNSTRRSTWNNSQSTANRWHPAAAYYTIVPELNPWGAVVATVRTKVLLLYGGRSTEHEISCRSAAFVLRNLDPERYEVHAVAIDINGRWLPQSLPTLREFVNQTLPIASHTSISQMTALPVTNATAAPLLNALQLRGSAPDVDRNYVVFPILHGTNGEDGSLQGMLDLAEVAYVGPDTLGSAVGMDKVVAKRLAASAGVPIVPYEVVGPAAWSKERDKVLARVVRDLGLPLFVKPTRLGSSVGITKVSKAEDLRAACELAFTYDERILIEKGLNVREIECAVLGDDDPDVSIPGEVIPKADFYSYDAKYLDPNGAGVAIPAPLTPEQAQEAQRLAKLVFQALELYGMSRVDLFLERETDHFYFNEVNTIPGMTQISQFPMLWEHSGVPPQALLDRLIDLALKRQQRRQKLQRHR